MHHSALDKPGTRKCSRLVLFRSFLFLLLLNCIVTPPVLCHHSSLETVQRPLSAQIWVHSETCCSSCFPLPGASTTLFAFNVNSWVLCFEGCVLI